MARSPRIVAVALMAAALVAVVGTPADASCAGEPSPSPHAFTGTVVSTTAEGRIARVTTGDGRTVEVRGTPDPTAVTSVDRTYRVGARYEFHPVNDASPYQDNACTATRQLSGATEPGATEPDSAAGDRSTGSPGDRWWGPDGTLLLAVVILLLAGAAAAGGRLVHRRWARQRGAAGDPVG